MNFGVDIALSPSINPPGCEGYARAAVEQGVEAFEAAGNNREFSFAFSHHSFGWRVDPWCSWTPHQDLRIVMRECEHSSSTHTPHVDAHRTVVGGPYLWGIISLCEYQTHALVKRQIPCAFRTSRRGSGRHLPNSLPPLGRRSASLLRPLLTWGPRGCG